MENTEIVAIPGNKDILEKLKELVREKHLVPFIGAGFSWPACPGWGEFLNNFFEGLKNDGFLKTGDEEEYQKLTESTDNPFEKMADWLINISERKRFQKEIQQAFDKELKPEMMNKFHLLNRVFPGLKITTNFDCLIEDNNPTGKNVEVYRGYEKEEVQRLLGNHKENSLLKIHGGLRDKKKIVLSTSQYKEVYGDAKRFSWEALLPQLLEKICTTFSLLFIGCSLHEDRTLMVMQEIQDMQPHYAIMMPPEDPDDKADVLRRLSRYGIEPLWVTKWEQIEQILAFLTEDTIEEETAVFDHGVTFVGREKELTQLEKNMVSADCEGSIQVITGRLFSIDGAGGVGKTTLALETARQMQKRGVFKDGVLPPIRVDELTPVSFAMHLAALLKMQVKEPLDKKAAQRLVTALLKNRHCLLVLDNAKEWKTLQYMLPHESCAVILVTSRNMELYDRLRLKFKELKVHKINLERFNDEEALALFEKMLEEKYIEEEKGIYLEIATNLGYLPLALKQVISLMLFGPHYSATTLRDKLTQEDRLKLLRTGAAESDSDSRTVETVFDLSEKLLTPELLQTLQILAVCAPGPIPLFFLEILAQLTKTTNIAENLERLHTLCWCDRRESDGQRSYELHQLVRELVQRRFEDQFREEYISLVHATFIDKEVHFSVKERLMPQLEEAFTWMKKNKDERLKKGWIYDLFHFCTYRGYGDFYIRLTHAVEECFPEDKWALQVVYGHRALIFRRQGQLKEAMKMHKKQEKISEQWGYQRGLAISYGNQALILKNWGQLKEAMTLHKKEEKIKVQLGDQAGLAACYGNQASILYLQDQIEEAMEFYKKQENICEQLGDQAGIAISWWNQGLIHNKKSNQQEQAELWQKSIAVKKQIGIPTEKNEKYLAKLLEEMDDGKGERGNGR